MKSELHYDLDGCHGRLVNRVRGSRPSTLGSLVLLLLAGVLGGAAWIHPFAPFGVLALAVAAAVGNHREEGSFDTSNQEPRTFEWLFAMNEVATPFRVERTLLYVGAGDTEEVVDLRGATIRSSSGVFVSPEWGEPIELYWNEADSESSERLADALRAISTRDRREDGSRADIPEALAAFAKARTEASEAACGVGEE